MRKIFGKIFLLSIILVATACSKDEEALYTSQESRIEAFVKSLKEQDQSITVSYQGNSTRVILKDGTGESLSKGGNAKIFYAGYKLTGSYLNAANLFATNNIELAKDSKIDTSDLTKFDAKTISPSEKNLVKGLAEGLVGVKAGEECIILFSGKYGFGKKNGTISAHEALAYYIWVEGISN